MAIAMIYTTLREENIMKAPSCKICGRPMLFITKGPPCHHWGEVKGNYYNYRCEKCDQESLIYKAQEGELVDFDDWEEVPTSTPDP